MLASEIGGRWDVGLAGGGRWTPKIGGRWEGETAATSPPHII